MGANDDDSSHDSAPVSFFKDHFVVLMIVFGSLLFIIWVWALVAATMRRKKTRRNLLDGEEPLIDKGKAEKVQWYERYLVGFGYYVFYGIIIMIFIVANGPENIGDFMHEYRKKTVPIYWVIVSLEYAIIVFGILFVRWPLGVPDSPEMRESLLADRAAMTEEVSLMIACHNSEENIRKTLEAALEILPPERIFVCDNGNSDEPTDNTKAVCAAVSEEYRVRHNLPAESLGVNYIWMSEGNKSLAFYYVAKNYNWYKYVLMIDDDVILPKTLKYALPMEQFRKEKTKAIAFTIAVENIHCDSGFINALTIFQDLEYKISGFIKLFQSQLGTTLSAHGAAALWDREMLVEVLYRHDTHFHGEDLQMGIILQNFNKNYRMYTCGTVSVPTVAPDHIICRGLTKCTCETPSFFKQRVTSWDPAAQAFVPRIIILLLFYWTRNAIILKPFLLYDLWSVFADYIRFPLMIYYLSMEDTRDDWLVWLAIFLGIYIVLMIVFNYWVLRLRPDLQIRVEYLALFPFYRAIELVVRLAALLYHILYYLPFVRTPRPIRERTHVPQPDPQYSPKPRGRKLLPPGQPNLGWPQATLPSTTYFDDYSGSRGGGHGYDPPKRAALPPPTRSSSLRASAIDSYHDQMRNQKPTRVGFSGATHVKVEELPDNDLGTSRIDRLKSRPVEPEPRQSQPLTRAALSEFQRTSAGAPPSRSSVTSGRVSTPPQQSAPSDTGSLRSGNRTSTRPPSVGQRQPSVGSRSTSSLRQPQPRAERPPSTRQGGAPSTANVSASGGLRSNPPAGGGADNVQSALKDSLSILESFNK